MGYEVNNSPAVGIRAKGSLVIENALRVVIKCNNGSTYPLYVGINEDATSKFQLDQSESYTIGPYPDGGIIKKLELRYDFEIADANNSAIIIIDRKGAETC